MNKLVLKTQRVRQNSQEFLLGIFKMSDILSFTRYTEYTILGFDEEKDNKPITRDEVQRKLNHSKVEGIADFLINDPLAIFPTNLVVSVPNHVIDKIIDDDNGNIELHINEIVVSEIEKIKKNQKGDIYLSIIDGQHRIRGVEVAMERIRAEIKLNEKGVRETNEKKYSDEIIRLNKILKVLDNFELAVSFFIDPVLEYQAMVFSTINRTQTKVSPDLVYSLFGLTKRDSPQKTALNIVNVLNGKESSPFFKRIRLAGSGSKPARAFYKGGNPVLSQAMIVKSILFYISKDNREADVERHKSRDYIFDHPNNSLPFRIYYGLNKDEVILKILNSFFSAVRDVFVDENNKSYWEFSDADRRTPTNILQTRIGFEALLMILKNILIELKEEEKEKKQTYITYLEKAKDLNIADNNEPKIYPFANKTKNKFYNDIGKKIWEDKFIAKEEAQ